MHILGFNCFAHDSAAAIVRDGEFLGLVEEERYVRRKHTGDFPRNAMRWCFEIAQISPKDLDHIVYYWRPDLYRKERALHLLRTLPWSLKLIGRRIGKELPMLRLRATLEREAGLDMNRTKLHFAEHHLCHAASTFLPSRFDQAAIMSIDAAGEWDCTWLGVGEGLDMRCLKRMQFPNSLGLLYGAITEYLGFNFASGEGKVMGLAPYGDASHNIAHLAKAGDPQRYIDAFRDIVRLGDDGTYQIDMSYFTYQYYGRPDWFSAKFYRTFGPARDREGEWTQHYFDMSAAIQQRVEEVGLHMAKWLRKTTGLKALCMAGGVCLNACMNGRILFEAGFDDVSVHPAANDAGTALGGCLWLRNTIMRQPREWRLDDAYLGPDVNREECRRAVERLAGSEGCDVHGAIDDAPAVAAEMLAQGKILGWYQGRMELGPRALGNRSILADPRHASMKDTLNARVKFREGFRPYAPSVLAEKCGEWFQTDYPSPYMILVYDVLPEKRSLIPAVTHVDGTARVQTVTQTHNPRYYRLIERFEALTGVPIVLNTSFNVRGEPIVLTAEQAIQCFLKTGMDALFLGDFLVTKRVSSAAAEMSETEVARAHALAAATDT